LLPVPFALDPGGSRLKNDTGASLETYAACDYYKQDLEGSPRTNLRETGKSASAATCEALSIGCSKASRFGGSAAAGCVCRWARRRLCEVGQLQAEPPSLRGKPSNRDGEGWAIGVDTRKIQLAM